MLQCCTGCGSNKEQSEFYANSRSPGKTVKRCKECIKSYHKTWYHTLGGADIVRRHALRNKYGITHDKYNEILEAQLGMCANPGCPNRGTELDHNHETGFVRAILCQYCNLALGQLKDSPARVEGLLAYIRKHT